MASCLPRTSTRQCDFLWCSATMIGIDSDAPSHCLAAVEAVPPAPERGRARTEMPLMLPMAAASSGGAVPERTSFAASWITTHPGRCRFLLNENSNCGIT